MEFPGSTPKRLMEIHQNPNPHPNIFLATPLLDRHIGFSAPFVLALCISEVID